MNRMTTTSVDFYQLSEKWIAIDSIIHMLNTIYSRLALHFTLPYVFEWCNEWVTSNFFHCEWVAIGMTRFNEFGICCCLYLKQTKGIWESENICWILSLQTGGVFLKSSTNFDGEDKSFWKHEKTSGRSHTIDGSTFNQNPEK